MHYHEGSMTPAEMAAVAERKRLIREAAIARHEGLSWADFRRKHSEAIKAIEATDPADALPAYLRKVVKGKTGTAADQGTV